MQRVILPIALFFFLSGCAGFSGMNRTHESRNESGRISRTSEPIFSSSESVGSYSHVEVNVENDQSQSIQPDTIEPAPPINEGNEPSMGGDGLKAHGLEISVIGSGLGHSYTTNFNSSSFKNLKWNPDADETGTGLEANMYLLHNYPYALTIGAGGFKNNIKTNSHNENNYYVHETIKAENYWIDTGIKYNLYSWLYLQGKAGLFYNTLKSEINTNAPVYTYDGLSGHDLFWAAGLGAGLESPWKGRLHLFAGCRFWCSLGEGPGYVIGQVNAGISYKF
jgi:hypothetical protein